MSILLVWAIVLMTLALMFYTLGVFGEKKTGTLLKWHVIVFWFGFICDTTGTTIMTKIAGEGSNFNLHSVTGAVALILMAFHAIWATYILIKGDEKTKTVFHKFSIIVWAIWLFPYVIGMIIGMA